MFVNDKPGAPAILHILRRRDSAGDTAYLKQARATYPGGVSELDAAIHLLRPPDRDLEVGEVTTFLEGAGEAPCCPRPTNPVYDRLEPTLLYTVVWDAFPQEPAWSPTLSRATHSLRSLAVPLLSLPFSWSRGTHSRGQTLRQEHLGAPLLFLVVTGRGYPEEVLGTPSTHPYALRHWAAPVRRHLLRGTEVRDQVHTFLWNREVTAIGGVHLVRLPPAAANDPRGPKAPEPHPGLGAGAHRMGRVP